MGGDVVEAHRLRVAQEQTQDAVAARRRPDRGLRLRIDAVGHEPLQARAARVDDAERRVARARDLGRQLEQPFEQRVEVPLGREDDPRLDEGAKAAVGFGRPH